MYKRQILSDYKKIESEENLDFISYSKIKSILKPSYNIVGEFNPRNYFAHFGFELNCTEVKFDGENLFVKYNDFVNKVSIVKYMKK